MSIAIWSAISLIFINSASFEGPLIAAQASVEEPAVASEANTDDLAEPQPLAIPEVVTEPAREAPQAPAPEAIADQEELYSGPLAFEDESDEAVATRVFDALEAITTLQGDFTQFAPSGAISSGRFYLRRPGLLRFEYDPPEQLLIVANGGIVYVRDEVLETTDSYPVGQTPLKFLLTKKIDRDDVDVMQVDRGVDTVAIALASRKDETEGELTLIVNAADMSLRRWIVRDLQNGSTIVTLENVKMGERLANRLFKAPEAGGQFLKN